MLRHELALHHHWVLEPHHRLLRSGGHLCHGLRVVVAETQGLYGGQLAHRSLLAQTGQMRLFPRHLHLALHRLRRHGRHLLRWLGLLCSRLRRVLHRWLLILDIFARCLRFLDWCDLSISFRLGWPILFLLHGLLEAGWRQFGRHDLGWLAWVHLSLEVELAPLCPVIVEVVG